MSKPTLKVTADFTEQFNETIKKFRRDAVLVGIPEDEAKRKPGPDEEQGPINNAALLAINEFGSPANNIPARPAMAIGIKNVQSEIIELLKKGAVMALSQGFGAIDVYYTRAGFAASSSIKKVINSQEGLKPLAPATIASREAQGFKGKKALLRTAQMRNAITFVVKGDTRGKR